MDILRRRSAGGLPRGGMLAVLLLACVLMSGLASMPALAANVGVRIDLSRQTMQVSLDGRVAYRWRVSTARRGYRTPTGRFRPVRLARMWYSTIYDYAPMPYSIFFYHGYAIHGTTELRNLGRPASHGCVRLHPDHARTLFELVKRYGRAATEIVITR
ncbi:L,D-transpeptidase [Breoghania sp. L-A4]|uniref:L,D-transpeptidase n=1 Tax=Breoghania sp. L-A4 TaxID=2304600 RepID=UPI0020BF4DA7|nr:L,D-transpeptidase [Breoghania sp. L-A4]